MTRSTLGGLATIALLLSGAIVSCGRDDGTTLAVSGQEGAIAGQVAGRLGTVTTTVPRTSTTPMTLPTLPLPDPIPASAYAPTPEIVLGRLRIPKLGIDEPMQEGITLTAIDRGPGHWPGTPGPGGLGNMVVAGHRTTKSKPFSGLDLLEAGDQVIFDMPEGSITYEVRGVIVVPEANIGIAAQSYAHTATLFACHPKGSATHRVVAKLRLLGPDGRPVDADSALPPVDFGSDPVTGTTLLVRDTGQPTGTGDPLGGSRS